LMLIAGVGFEVISSVWWVFTRRKNDSRELCFEMGNSLRVANALSQFKKEKLELTKFYLQGKVDRSERRVKLLFGSKSTFIALFGLAYSLLAHFDYLNWLPSMFFNSLGMADLWKVAVLIFLALFAGFLLGTFVLKGNISRYQNKIFTLDFSLKTRDLNI